MFIKSRDLPSEVTETFRQREEEAVGVEGRVA